MIKSILEIKHPFTLNFYRYGTDFLLNPLPFVKTRTVFLLLRILVLPFHSFLKQQKTEIGGKPISLLPTEWERERDFKGILRNWEFPLLYECLLHLHKILTASKLLAGHFNLLGINKGIPSTDNGNILLMNPAPETRKKVSIGWRPFI